MIHGIADDTASPRPTTLTTPSSVWRWAVAGPIACGCAMAAATVYVAMNDPAAPGTHLPTCPLYAMTGLWCPGCGLTRATHAALRGDIAAAFGFNLFFPAFLAAIVLGWLAWLRASLQRPSIRWLTNISPSAAIAAGVVLIGFGVLRNVPGFQALAP